MKYCGTTTGNQWTTENTNLILKSKDIDLLAAEHAIGRFEVEHLSRVPGDGHRYPNGRLSELNAATTATCPACQSTNAVADMKCTCHSCGCVFLTNGTETVPLEYSLVAPGFDDLPADEQTTVHESLARVAERPDHYTFYFFVEFGFHWVLTFLTHHKWISGNIKTANDGYRMTDTGADALIALNTKRGAPEFPPPQRSTKTTGNHRMQRSRACEFSQMEHQPSRPADAYRSVSRSEMKKKLSIAGFLVGVGCQLAMTIYAFSQVPGLPGLLEVFVIIFIAAFVGGIGAAVGFAIGSALELFRKKNASSPVRDKMK